MEFRILGPLEARAGGERIALGPPKQRALLALLLLHVDRVVTTDRILDALWGDDAAGKEKALWVHISKLRSALEPHRVERGESSVLVTRDHGYTIRADPSTVDAHCFEAAVAEARGRIDHDPDGTAAMLREALGLWRGSALQDVAYEQFAQTEIGRLEELRLEAIEMRIEADLRCGLATELVAELETLVEEHPLRERPVAQLMRARYRAGRHAEALRAFQRYRVRIGDELGLEPSPELRRLEEQVLLHDRRLAPRASEAPRSTNPFKGLHAFQEADAEDFFGRDRLVADVVNRIDAGCRLVALVGPSGSGKSSVARAGVVPALRKGALAGSERWPVASMVPGSHPFAELEAALLRATIDAPDSLDTQLADPTLGLLRAVLRLLPDDTARLVLVIDQFEELFTLVDDDAERDRFLANLVAASDDARGRVIVVLTLRADSYHLPLSHGEFAARLGPGVVNVLPLTTDELEEAAAEPAARQGVTPEPALLAELLTDVVGEPGALPVFQYALTELFERRDGDRLTLDAYRTLGGVRGVLSRRADDVYHQMTLAEQTVAHQLFLRLVTVSEREQWSRRRVPASELVAIDVDVITMESVIDQLGRHRFLAFDRDHGTGAPTVEVAHEALLTGWDRLRGWIEDAGDDVTRRAALDAAVREWAGAGRDHDYLFSGNRLADYDRWRVATTMSLTTTELEFLDAAIARRDESDIAEAARASREASIARRARRRWWALVAVVVLVVAAVGGRLFLFGPSDPPRIAMLRGASGQVPELMVDGMERAARDFDLEVVTLSAPFADLDAELSSLADSGTDLVLFADRVFLDQFVDAATQHPDTTWAYVDIPIDDAPAVTFAEHEGAFLAGAAAALTTSTGTVGFVGGFQFDVTERFRAGFEDGVHAVDPSIEILATYTALDLSGFARDDLAWEAATDLYERGADVVIHAAGAAGHGVFQAAREQSAAQGRHLWAIGADSDQYLEVPAENRPHVLTSTIKRFDVAVYELISDFVDGDLQPTLRELMLADGAVGYSTSGNHLSPEAIASIATLEADVTAGLRTVSRSPSGPLDPPPSTAVSDTGTLTFDGSTCRYDGPASLDSTSVLEIEFINATHHEAGLWISSADGPLLAIPAEPGGANDGFMRLPVGRHTARCSSRSPAGEEVDVIGPTFEVLSRAGAAAPPVLAPAADVSAAERTAREFVDAYGTFDADRAIDALTDGALAQVWASPDELRLELTHLQATGYHQLIRGCDPVSASATSVTIRCRFDLHLLGSDDLGLGPYGGNFWELTARNGEVVGASLHWDFEANGFDEEVWEPFGAWIAANHPNDIPAMYRNGITSPPHLTPESVALWRHRLDEYITANR